MDEVLDPRLRKEELVVISQIKWPYWMYRI